MKFTKIIGQILLLFISLYTCTTSSCGLDAGSNHKSSQVKFNLINEVAHYLEGTTQKVIKIQSSQHPGEKVEILPQNKTTPNEQKLRIDPVTM